MKRRIPLALVVAIAIVSFVLRRVQRSAEASTPTNASHPVRVDAPDPQRGTPRSTLPPADEGRPAGRRHRVTPGAGTVLVALGLLVSLGIPTTWATLTDQTVMAPVSVSAGTVNAPTGVTATQTATAARINWTAPTGGIAPDGYRIYRSTTAGSYGAALASPTTSPYDDTTAAECTPYYYTAAARRASLTSNQATPEASITLDRTAPTLGTAGGHAYFDPNPRPKVPDYVRVVGGNVEVYAQVEDNCAAANELTVNFNFGAPFNTTNAATFGNYTPVAGGPSYNYMWGPYALPANSLANGQVMTWSVTATDPHGNAATLNATSVTGDGVGPTFGTSEVVSAVTNYFDQTKNVGEILSGSSTQTALKNQGYWIYTNATDPSGDISGITANATSITTSASAVALPSGTYSTDNGMNWDFRNATALVPNTTLAEGATPSVTLTATDALGNTSTQTTTAKINNTAITTASCANTGNGSNTLNSGDATTWTLGNATTGPTIDPASIRPAWTTSPFSFTGTATITNSTTTDFMDLNGALGMTMLAGATRTNSWTLGNTNWVTATVNIPNSVVSMPTFNTVRLAYGNPATSITDRNATARAYIGTSVRTASGLPVAATITSSTCSSSAW